ncbi:fungal hydrophobin-domain-containing protein [Xylariaceae sp. FL1651]|nr:fungal hydrophobin-domain-containing protein [Xylariaceae sp. FL1651]
MKLTTALLVALTTTATSVQPARSSRRGSALPSLPLPLPGQGLGNLCPGIDSPQCCQTDVDGIIDLTCESPAEEPQSIKQLSAICAEDGLTAQCCTLPLVGDALLCTAV